MNYYLETTTGKAVKQNIHTGRNDYWSHTLWQKSTAKGDK
jgi:hypothetical protein